MQKKCTIRVRKKHFFVAFSLVSRLMKIEFFHLFVSKLEMRKQKKNSNFQSFTILLHQHTNFCVFPFSSSLVATNEKNEQTSEFVLNPQLISEEGGREEYLR